MACTSTVVLGCDPSSVVTAFIEERSTTAHSDEAEEPAAGRPRGGDFGSAKSKARGARDVPPPPARARSLVCRTRLLGLPGLVFRSVRDEGEFAAGNDFSRRREDRCVLESRLFGGSLTSSPAGRSDGPPFPSRFGSVGTCDAGVTVVGAERFPCRVSGVESELIEVLWMSVSPWLTGQAASVLARDVGGCGIPDESELMSWETGPHVGEYPVRSFWLIVVCVSYG